MGFNGASVKSTWMVTVKKCMCVCVCARVCEREGGRAGVLIGKYDDVSV